MRGFSENAGIKVAAALRRGGSPVQTDRRPEIGSHATPMTAIFIHGGELEEVMGHFHQYHRTRAPRPLVHLELPLIARIA
ncbi:MAG TPA: hypothetical protein VMW38_20850 [Terriglobia bacterium]|nr:hypothetical protein [Terriglobia bacterium]